MTGNIQKRVVILFLQFFHQLFEFRRDHQIGGIHFLITAEQNVHVQFVQIALDRMIEVRFIGQNIHQAFFIRSSEITLQAAFSGVAVDQQHFIPGFGKRRTKIRRTERLALFRVGTGHGDHGTVLFLFRLPVDQIHSEHTEVFRNLRPLRFGLLPAGEQQRIVPVKRVILIPVNRPHDRNLKRVLHFFRSPDRAVKHPQGDKKREHQQKTRCKSAKNIARDIRGNRFQLKRRLFDDLRILNPHQLLDLADEFFGIDVGDLLTEQRIIAVYIDPHDPRRLDLNRTDPVRLLLPFSQFRKFVLQLPVIAGQLGTKSKLCGRLSQLAAAGRGNCPLQR